MRWPSRIIKYCSIAEASVLKESILLQRYFFINDRDHSLVGESGKTRFAYSSKNWSVYRRVASAVLRTW